MRNARYMLNTCKSNEVLLDDSLRFRTVSNLVHVPLIEENEIRTTAQVVRTYRHMKKAPMLTRLLIVFLPLIGSFVAGFFGRFLGSEGSPLFSIPSLLLMFCGLFVIFTLLYHYLLFSKRKKSAMILYVLICVMLLSFSHLLRLKILAFLGMTIPLILYVSFCSSGAEPFLANWMVPESYSSAASSEASVNQPPDRNGAGPSNAAPADSPQGSFPSVPPCLTPLPSGPSVPSVPSLPSVEEHNLGGSSRFNNRRKLVLIGININMIK